jgi:hypothetical protein
MRNHAVWYIGPIISQEHVVSIPWVVFSYPEHQSNIFLRNVGIYCNGVRWPSYPRTPLPKKGIRCHHIGQHHDMYIIYSTTLHQGTLTQILVHYNGKKWVHQSIVHKLLPKNYHKESLITSCCHIFLSFCFPTNQFGIWNYKSNRMNPNITPSLRTLQFGTKELNHLSSYHQQMHLFITHIKC